jgi:protein SMG7
MSGVTNDLQPSRFKHSIWAASSDEQPLKFATGSSPKSTYQLPRQYHNDLSSTWTSYGVGGSHLVQPNGIGSLQPVQPLAQPSQVPLTSRLNTQYHHRRIPSLPSSSFPSSFTSYPTVPLDPLPYSHLTQTQHQLPFSNPAFGEKLPTSPFLPPKTTMNSTFVNDGLGHSHVSIPIGNPVESLGHTRQASYGQAQSPQQFYASQTPVPGQPFASLPQTW